MDLFIRATAENVERLKRAFRVAYDGDPNVDAIQADDLLGDYPAVRYHPPSGDLYFDVLTRLGEAARFESVEAEVKDVEGIRVRVATPAAAPRSARRRFRSFPAPLRPFLGLVSPRASARVAEGAARAGLP